MAACSRYRMAHRRAQLRDLALEPGDALVQLAQAVQLRRRAGRRGLRRLLGPGRPALHRPAAAARSAPPCARGGAPGARPARARSAARASRARSSRSANACIRSVRCLSSPGVCGPRSISTHMIACSPASIGSASASRCRYFARAAAGAAGQAGEAAALQTVQRVADDRVVVVDHRVAVGGLVARQPQRVERQRIGVGGRALLLQQAAEHPDLAGAQS